ncbi:unnamed protein product [Paramecium octaurelia]|uniref:Uncharacterized protein n=1 Tax=Paramecium octaurelia TaxID=43137 RepID=A0A8S1V4R9_PAROT|nr:unnamed protein product [Paramecium octaurelia]
METFKCKQLNHENKEIIGFCFNQNCQNTTEYCYECLQTNHSEHFNDCIQFTKIIQFINEFMQVQNQSRKQLQEMSKRLQNYLEQSFKKMDQDIKTLKQLTQKLQNKDYLTFKSQINIIKRIYQKGKENEQCILFDQLVQNNRYSNQILSLIQSYLIS